MTSKVYVALRVKATPERAFAVFTQEIGAWWRPSGLFQTTPRAPCCPSPSACRSIAIW